MKHKKVHTPPGISKRKSFRQNKWQRKETLSLRDSVQQNARIVSPVSGIDKEIKINRMNIQIGLYFTGVTKERSDPTKVQVYYTKDNANVLNFYHLCLWIFVATLRSA